MLRKIFPVIFVCVFAVSAFAQKKDDDNKPCTRGQFAQLIVDTLPWVKELPNVVKEHVSFLDIDSKHPNYEAVQAVCNKGIIEACPMMTRYGPNTFVTRNELAVHLGQLTVIVEKNYKIEFLSVDGYPPHLKDVEMHPHHWVYEPLTKIISKGIISGFPDGNFHGKQPATIKEVKLVLQRIKEKTEALLKEKEAAKK